MQRDRGDRRARRRASSTPSPSPGQSILLNANAPNFGSMYVMLDDFHDRHGADLYGRRHRRAAAGDASQDEIRDGLVNVFGAPPVDGLGTAGGFKIMVEDRGDIGPGRAAGRRPTQIVADGNADAGLAGPVHQLPGQHALAVPRHRPRPGARRMGVSMSEVFNTLQVYLGSLLRQRLQPLRPHLAGQRPGRRRRSASRSSDLQAAARSATTRGEMVPLGSAGRRSRDVSGPVMVMRYNMYPAAAINGNAGAGRQLRARRSS